ASSPATTAPTTAGTPATPPAGTSAADLERAVRDYYALLPGNTEAAFGLLSSGAQAKSGGRAGFDRFYAGLQSVTLQNLRQTGDNTAEATVVFVRRDGGSSSEAYRFQTSTAPDGRTIMESFSRA
ncbi:MAG TPA: serine/threonine protein kinase, partial [Pseudonocardia sp.]|nr:serine/threonine protein kinase [Pseudonocardia sp.]